MTRRAPALLCTDTIVTRVGDRIAAAAPALEVVARDGDGPVAGDDLDRVAVGVFSADAVPERAAHVRGATVRAPHLRWLHPFSAGTDHPGFGALRERGVRVTSSSGAAAAPIARTVMMYLLALSRDLPGLLRDQVAHHWDPRRYDDIEGRTMGVLGMGPIGLEVIRLAEAMACGRSGCAAPLPATSRARRGRSAASPSWRRPSTS